MTMLVRFTYLESSPLKPALLILLSSGEFNSRGWRDDSAIESTGCFSRAPGLIPGIHMVAYNCLTPVSRKSASLLAPEGTENTHGVLTHMQTKYKYTQIISIVKCTQGNFALISVRPFLVPLHESLIPCQALVCVCWSVWSWTSAFRRQGLPCTGHIVVCVCVCVCVCVRARARTCCSFSDSWFS